MKICLFQILCEGRFLTVSLLRNVCYSFSVEVCFVTDSLLRSICYDSKRKFACYRFILEVFW